MTRDEALAWAAAARRARDDLVAAVGEGRLDLAGALARAATDPLAGRVDVVAVVQALPGWGKVTSRRALAGLGIGERTPLAAVPADRLLDGFRVAP